MCHSAPGLALHDWLAELAIIRIWLEKTWQSALTQFGCNCLMNVLVFRLLGSVSGKEKAWMVGLVVKPFCKGERREQD